MDDKIWEEFMEYLRCLITSGEINGSIPEQYKPIQKLSTDKQLLAL